MKRLLAVILVCFAGSAYAVNGEPTPEVLVDLELNAPIPTDGLQPAVRVNPPAPPPTYAPTGLWGQPFAPPGLDNCAEMGFYRQQWGLPEAFQGIGWRESNCRNSVTSSTGCCRGHYQLDVTLHLRDHRIGWRYRDNCAVHSYWDVFGEDPLAKQKQACAAKQLFDVMGYSPWSATL